MIISDLNYTINYLRRTDGIRTNITIHETPGIFKYTFNDEFNNYNKLRKFTFLSGTKMIWHYHPFKLISIT